MKKLIFILLILTGGFFVVTDVLYAAHILEPLGTEIAATPPRGRLFGQIEYAYSNDDPDEGEEIEAHSLALEFEIGIGERTQLNLEGEILLEESHGDEEESGIEEIAFGLKHRFMDETQTLPDAAFLIEFVPGVGLKDDESEIKGSILLTKNFTNQFLTHLELGYIYETENEEEEIENANIFVYNIAPIYRYLPDQLLLIAELNGKSNFEEDIHQITIAPEAIYVMNNMAFKLAIPIGVTDDADDIGVRFGISKLF